jgi:hypothetical protein
MRIVSIPSIVLAICSVLTCPGADATNRINGPQPKSPVIKTNFVADAELTGQEIKQALSLAQQCGIGQPGEIRTFYYLPSRIKGLLVKSEERVKGADILFDEIVLMKTDWEDFKPDEKAKKVGKFWANPSHKFTTHLRVYDFRKEKIRVRIGNGITTELADKIIPLIAAKKVLFPNNPPIIGYDEMKKMIDSKPSGLEKPLEDQPKLNSKLWLYFEGTRNALEFHFEKGELILDEMIFIYV